MNSLKRHRVAAKPAYPSAFRGAKKKEQTARLKRTEGKEHLRSEISC